MEVSGKIEETGNYHLRQRMPDLEDNVLCFFSHMHIPEFNFYILAIKGISYENRSEIRDVK